MKLADLVKSEIQDAADAGLVENLICQRDPDLELVLKNFSFAELDVIEPSQEVIEQANRESDKTVDEDSFKLRYERMQELLKKMNEKFAEKKLPVSAYEFMFK